MAKLKALSKAVQDLVRRGFPESTAQKIANDGLPMDHASRLARAEGFFDKALYRGTAAKPSTMDDSGQIFNKFELWERGDPARSTVRSEVSKLGVSLAEQARNC